MSSGCNPLLNATDRSMSPGRGERLCVGADGQHGEHERGGRNGLCQKARGLSFRMAGPVQNTASFKFASWVTGQCGRYISHTNKAPTKAPIICATM